MSEQNKLNKIELEIDDRVLKRLKDAINTAYLCDGEGIQWEFIERIVRAIDDGKDKLVLQPKN